MINLEFNLLPSFWLAFVPALLNLSLLWYVLAKLPKQAVTWTFAAFLATSSLWELGVSWGRIAGNAQLADLGTSLLSVTLLFTATGFHFVLLYSRHNRIARSPWFLILNYGSAFFLANLMDAQIFDYSQSLVHTPWGWSNTTSVPWVVSLLTNVQGIAMLILIISNVVMYWKNPRERKSALILAVGFSVPLIQGTITEGLFRDMGVPDLPLTTASMAIFSLAAFIAIRRYKFLELTTEVAAPTILSTMSDSLFVTDAEGYVIIANPAAEDILGLKSRQIIGRPVTDFVPEASKLLEQLVNLPAATQTLVAGEELTLKTEQVTLPVSASASVVRDATGHPIGLTLICHDLQKINAYIKTLTEQKGELSRNITQMQQLQTELQTEKEGVEQKVEQRTQELQIERAKLQSSIESMSLGFALLDNADNVQIRNASIGKILHYPDDWQFADLAADFGGTISLAASCAQVRKTNKPLSFPAVSFGPAILRLLLSPVWDGKKVIGTVVLLEDITEAKVMERSKDEFFSIASHELRTPLTAIKGNASMMISYYNDSLKDPSLHEMVEDIHTSSVRLIEIVNDFLDTSRLEQGKIQFKLQPFALDKIIEQVSYEMAAVLKQKNLSFHTDETIKTLGQLPMVYADPDRTKQIIYNLVGNAAKFTESGRITLSAQTEGEVLKVHVTDTGRGISVEGQKLLFRKFQQAGESLLTRDTTRGTGLGLYISKLLVQGMGGQINLEQSTPGKGTTFFFTLPVATKEAIAAGAVPLDSADTSNTKTGLTQPSPGKAPAVAEARILIFEDDPYVQRMYQRLFSFSNFIVEMANDGENGVARAKAFKPQLILLDIMMPKVNGLELLRSLKSDPATKSLPTLMLTNVGEVETIDEAKKLGVAGYLIKADFSPEQLLEEVKKHLR